MTFIHVDIHQFTHTCPGNPEPHPVDIRRTIVAVLDGGPCRQPITVHSGGATAVIACGRHESADRQCPACRVTVIERSITTTNLGHHGPQHPTTDTGAAA